MAYNTKFHTISSTNAEEDGACGHQRECPAVRLPLVRLFYELYGKHELTNLRSCTVHVELMELSPVYVQLIQTNYYKIVKLLKSFKLTTVAPTCFGLHKPSAGSSQPALRQSYRVDMGYVSLYNVICTCSHSTDNFKLRYVMVS